MSPPQTPLRESVPTLRRSSVGEDHLGFPFGAAEPDPEGGPWPGDGGAGPGILPSSLVVFRSALVAVSVWPVDGRSDAMWAGEARPDSAPPLGWQSARLALGARLSGTFERDGDRLDLDWAVTFDVDGASALTVKVGTTGDTDGELRDRPTGFVLTGAPDVGGSVDRVTVLCKNLACASYRTIAQVIALDPLTVSVRSVRS